MLCHDVNCLEDMKRFWQYCPTLLYLKLIISSNVTAFEAVSSLLASKRPLHWFV